MKILHMINTLNAGGAELHLLTLCRYLRRAGVEVVVAYLKAGKGSRFLGPEFEGEGVRVVNLHGGRVWDGRPLLRALRLVRKERPDILHTHLPRADLVGFLVRTLLLTPPWVCSVHGIYSRSWHGAWTLPLFRFVWRRADRVVAISQAVKDWLVRDCSLREGKVKVVYYGIEPERFANPLRNLRSVWNLDDGPVIGSIGRLEPLKGHDLLIRAMPAVLEKFPQARLLIAGYDPWGYGRTLKGLVESLGLSEKVRFLDFQDDIPSFLHGLDLFAFASRSEGFGQVLIEAMASGKPVVASRIPPITEIVVDGKTGLLVTPDDPEAFARAILWLLEHLEEARRMGEEGRRRVQEAFSAEGMAIRTLEIYEEVLRGSGKGPGIRI